MKKFKMKIFFVLTAVIYPITIITPKFIIKFFLRFANIGESSVSFGIRYLLYKRLFKILGEKVIFSPFLTI